MGIFFKNKETKIRVWHWIFLIVVVVLVMAAQATRWFWPRLDARVAGRELRLALADTQAHLYRGLGNRPAITGDGMAFLFGESARHIFVMRDMRFAIDIVWVENFNGDNACYLSKFSWRKLFATYYLGCRAKVVDIAPNVPPEPGKNEKELLKYAPRVPSTMVLELPSGFAENNGLKIGDIVEFGGISYF